MLAARCVYVTKCEKYVVDAKVILYANSCTSIILYGV